MGNPIIIAGQFRSGTSFLTKAIHDAGIPMFEWPSRHCEDADILSYNHVEMTTNPMKANTMPWSYSPSPMFIRKLKAYKRRRERQAKGGPYGFKCPNIMLIWQAYHEVFPDAVWVLCLRNPVNAIVSQMRREKIKEFNGGLKTYTTCLLNFLSKPGGFHVMNYDGSIEVMEKYFSDLLGVKLDLASNWKWSNGTTTEGDLPAPGPAP